MREANYGRIPFPRRGRANRGTLDVAIRAAGKGNLAPLSHPNCSSNARKATPAWPSLTFQPPLNSTSGSSVSRRHWGDPPDFAGVNLDSARIFLQKGTPNPGSEAGAVYFVAGDADELYEFHRANGVEIAHAIGDRPYGIRDYVVRDPHGYYLVFGHHLFNLGSSIMIKRVDVPVRLEKRLAAAYGA